METECASAGSSNLRRNHLENDNQQPATASAAYANANAIHTTNNPIPRNGGIEAIEQMSLYFFIPLQFNEQKTETANAKMSPITLLSSV